MKANLRARNEHEGNDEGVSPVIAVILMVAITVVLAATVYVWVSGFSSDEGGPENAQVRASGFDSDNNGANDWIRLTLVRGENAPYASSVADFTLIHGSTTVDTSTDALCTAIHVVSPIACNTAEDYIDDDAAPDWDVGDVLYVPCQADAPHQLTLSLRGSTVMDERISCDEPAPTS